LYGVRDYRPDYPEPSGVTCYQCAHNILKSHVRAYRLYYAEFVEAQNGLVGITLNSNMVNPATTDPADVAAAERSLEFSLGWFANPLTVDGNYPQIMIDKVKGSHLELMKWQETFFFFQKPVRDQPAGERCTDCKTSVNCDSNDDSDCCACFFYYNSCVFFPCQKVENSSRPT
jgi:hypothetical protein